jgi:phosphatidylserine/phosphatidylglycerophosphate/cardiolipin synthase-like enzyme
VPVQGVRIHESLKARSKIVATTNILVQDVPFFGRIFGADTDGLVKDFFKGDNVAVRALPIFLSLLNLPSFMHAKAVVLDGTTAFVLGSTMSQSYFGAHDHLIHDARHGGSLIHDMSLKVQGPAVEHIDRTFTTLWNAADSDASALSPSTGQTPATQDDLGLQIVRTLPGGTITASHTGGAALSHGETSALEAYQRAIAQAQKYIYLEDQYFTAPEVFDALLRRMKLVPGLELILVLNCNPDVSGYPEKQVQLLEQFRSDLAKALGAAQAEKRVGLFTIWSCDEQVTPYEIMPIYVHSKTAIIDDVWATIGSANLDGASLNHIQLATIVQQKLADAIEDGKWWKRLLLGLTIFALTPLVMAMVLAMKIGITRPSQHANPGQSRQPIRSSELNVVICEQNPQHSVPNKTVKQFRESLWGEHLGLGTSLPPIGNGWVDLWQRRAKEKLASLQSDPPKPIGQRSKHPAKILAWTAETDPEQYLRACLGAELRDRKVRLRSKADKFNFKTGTWERR